MSLLHAIQNPPVAFPAHELIKMASCPDPDANFRATLKQLIASELERAKSGDDLAARAKRAELEGGWKIRSQDVWGSHPARQLMQLVEEFARVQFGLAEVHICDRWVNVMEPGSVSAPHAHSNADVAVVYMLDRGNPNLDPTTQAGMQAIVDDESGRFGVCDPRVQECCPVRPGFPTADVAPFFDEQILIGFPGSIIHWVSKFRGPEARITLAFNLKNGPKPAGFDDEALNQPVNLPRTIIEN